MVYKVGDVVRSKKGNVKLTVTKAGVKKDGTQETVECRDEQGTVQTYWVDQLK